MQRFLLKFAAFATAARVVYGGASRVSELPPPSSPPIGPNIAFVTQPGIAPTIISAPPASIFASAALQFSVSNAFNIPTRSETIVLVGDTTLQSLATPTALATPTLCSQSCSACNPSPIVIKMPRRGLAERALKIPINGLSKRILTTPADFGGGTTRFLLSEYVLAEFVRNVRPEDLGTSSGFGRKLIGNKYNAAVGGLRGCTSVIVVSQSAVWLSHFWEVPSFRERTTTRIGQPRTAGDTANFEDQVLNEMENGATHIPGLRQFTGPGGVFSAAEDPRWIIVTPRLLTGVQGQYQYDPELTAMKAVLGKLFPNVPPVVIDYKRQPGPLPETATGIGKILVQYDPFQGVLQDPNNPCFLHQRAIIRLWVQDGPEPVFERQWNANRDQFIPVVWRNPASTCESPSDFPQAPREQSGPNLVAGQAPGTDAIPGVQVLFPDELPPRRISNVGVS